MDGTLTCFNMLVEKRNPLIKEMLEKMLNWKLEAKAESTMAFELLKFIKGGFLGIMDFYKLVLLVQLDTAGDGSSSSLDSEVDSCSKSCVKAYATLKEQYDIKLRDNSLVENKKKLEKAEKERDELKLTLEKFQNSSKSLNNLLESQVIDKFKTGLGNFIPFKTNLTFMDEIFESENMDVTTIVTPSNVKTVESNYESAEVKSNGDAVEPKTIIKNSFRPPVIED
ncbi:hypothetical protein Tco_1111942 [Tanacetum coccineum]|uniref:Uncharacterized protein n=1 Tax=Tanacetum coccineum TaxID=301880 RepID=A0ABQ5IRI6_9ASTR